MRGDAPSVPCSAFQRCPQVALRAGRARLSGPSCRQECASCHFRLTPQACRVSFPAGFATPSAGTHLRPTVPADTAKPLKAPASRTESLSLRVGPSLKVPNWARSPPNQTVIGPPQRLGGERVDDGARGAALRLWVPLSLCVVGRSTIQPGAPHGALGLRVEKSPRFFCAHRPAPTLAGVAKLLPATLDARRLLPYSGGPVLRPGLPFRFSPTPCTG